MDTERTRKLHLNSITSLTNQIITLICGFVLPRLILSHYGSDVNGLVSSINQFLNLITFLDLGVGAVVTSTFYGPLAKGDNKSISQIYLSAKKFFKRIATAFVGYIVVLVIVYPNAVDTGFSWWYVASLIIAISITLFSQYYFGIVNQLLLNADQRSYISLIAQCTTTLLNTVACVVLMEAGASIQVVRLATSIIYLGRPLIMTIYVNHHYSIDKNIKLEGEPIKQKWNGLAQHIASVVLNNTDTVVLTLFSTLSNVSIYGVYNLVVNGMRTLCSSLTVGINALFGNMLAKNETELLDKTFSDFEWLIHTCITLLFTMCGILIVPFVQVYTLGVNDADYVAPLFGALITIAQAVYCIRLPYNMMVQAAGHYKQTQLSSIIEMSINIIISVLSVVRFGLVGVAIGTLAAMLYRTIYLAWYLSRNIINRNMKHFWKHVAVDCILVMAMVLACSWIHMDSISVLAWIKMAIVVGIICLLITLLVNLMFYKEHTISRIKGLLHRK